MKRFEITIYFSGQWLSFCQYATCMDNARLVAFYIAKEIVNPEGRFLPIIYTKEI